MIGAGIDVSKRKSTVATIGDAGEVIMKPQGIKYNHGELDKLIKWITNQEGWYLWLWSLSSTTYHYPVLLIFLSH